MRKMTLKLKPNALTRMIHGKIFDTIYEMRMVEMLKMDYVRGVKVGVMEVIMKDGFTIDDIKIPKNVKILDSYEKSKGKYVAIVKSHIESRFKSLLLKMADIDVIWDKPTYVKRDEMFYTCYGDSKSLKRILSVTKIFGKQESVSFSNEGFKVKDVKSTLTEKQVEIFDVAKREGYYEYPRKLNAKELAEKMEISKSTLVEHLRRIENKIISGIE